jgi:hypothetical protein
MAKRRDKPRRRWARWLLRAGAVVLVATLGLWIAIHRVEWLGPAIADGIRSVVGPGPVAWMEDLAYGAQDRINRWRYDGDAPKTFWEPPAAPVPAAPVEPGKPSPSFLPEPFSAPFPEVAAAGDGIWIPVTDPAEPDGPVSTYKSMVHPDQRRSFAVLAVVAMDVSAFELHLVAGTKEPESMRLRLEERPGKIPDDHAPLLFAAFNGGFKATHGQYGMMLGGVEFLPPRDIACTFVRYKEGGFRIATFSKIKGEVADMLYYRQTPPCLVEDGEIHHGLTSDYAKGWGATVSGDTMIRRSAIGLDRDGKTLFYGLGEAMSAQSIARGMRAAGAHWAAELDVNHSYPRFLFYERPDPSAPPVATSAIIPGIDFQKDQYVTRPSPRDFFYLTRNRRRASF